MLQAIAAERDFEVKFTETNEDFTPERLKEYELVVFLHTSGDVLNDDEQRAFAAWMVDGAGAFVGVGRAADTEPAWDFYKELLGQYYDTQSFCCPEADIAWATDALDFPAVNGLPSPWSFADLWFYFYDVQTWSTKPGFKILGTIELRDFRVAVPEGSPCAADPAACPKVTVPVSFARQWSNFRSFYTALGHQTETFRDPHVRQHVTAAILWVMRREHLLP